MTPVEQKKPLLALGHLQICIDDLNGCTRHVSPDPLHPLGHFRDIIAINQDSSGEPVKLHHQRFTYDHDTDVGSSSKPRPSHPAPRYDISNTTRTLSLDFSDIGIKSADLETSGQAFHIVQSQSQSRDTVPPSHRTSSASQTSKSRLRLPRSGRTPEVHTYPTPPPQPSSSARHPLPPYPAATDSPRTIPHFTSPPPPCSPASTPTSYILPRPASQGSNVRGATVSRNPVVGGVVDVLFSVTGYGREADIIGRLLVRSGRSEVGE